MRATIATLICLTTLVSSGCALSSPGFLDDYATVGGKWQRSDPTSGRVGSIFSDPGTTVGNASMSGEAGMYGGTGEFYGDGVDGEFYEGAVEEYYGPDSMPSESYYGETPSGSADFNDGVIILGEDW